MFISNISVNEDAQLFETSIITITGVYIVWGHGDAQPFETPTINNHSVPARSAQVYLEMMTCSHLKPPLLKTQYHCTK